MNHLAAGKAVQFAIVAMGGGLGREVLADETKVSTALSSPIPAAPEVLRTPPNAR